MAGQANSSTSSVLQTILAWSKDRPLWQRDVLRRLVQGCPVADADLKELTSMCRADHGLDSESALAPVPLAADQIPATLPGGHSVSLRALRNLNNVNALARNQELRFGDVGLTVIYGDNGAGKSGYARVLKRACRARHQLEAILPDAFVGKSAGTPSATIDYRIDGTDRSVQWTEGKPREPVLSAVNVFDSHCAGIHVTGTNELAFTPFGLDVMEQLGAACRSVQSALQTEKKQLESSQHVSLRTPKVRPTTAAGKLLKSLSATTIFETIRVAVTLTPAEEARFAQLQKDLSQDPGKVAADLRMQNRRLQRLSSLLEMAHALLSDAAVEELKNLSEDEAAKVAAASVAADTLFKGEPLLGVGASSWRALWEAARRFSEAEAYPSKPYPVTAVTGDGARCVLCQQTFSAGAADRMQRFQAFVQADTQQAAETAKTKVAGALEALGELDLTAKTIREPIEQLRVDHPEVATHVLKFLRVARWRRHAVLQCGAMHNWADIPPLPDNREATVRAVVTAITERIVEIEAASVADKRAAILEEAAELEDRVWVHGYLDDIKQELARLRRLHAIDKCIGDTDTKAITTKSKAIAQEVVTDQLRDSFAQELQRIGVSSVRVELVLASGQYGVARYKLQFVGNPSARLDIVSEGEHRCIALAAFLSELTTADHRSTLVFDDPVSSLDHNYRERLAQRLVVEAGVRQVVVFTHDIVFLHDLLARAETAKVPCLAQRVCRNNKGIGAVDDDVPWKAKKTSVRLDELGKEARAAKRIFEVGDQDGYEAAAKEVYNKLRATVERAIEEVLFAGVVLRWRSYVNLKDLSAVAVLKSTDCDTFVKIFDKCCDITTAHDQGAGRNAPVPHPHELLQDVQDLETLVREIKDRRNNKLVAVAVKGGAVPGPATKG